MTARSNEKLLRSSFYFESNNRKRRLPVNSVRGERENRVATHCKLRGAPWAVLSHQTRHELVLINVHRWLNAAVVPQCLRGSGRAQSSGRHGLSVSPLHICQTPLFGRCQPAAPDGGGHRAVLSRRQGAGVPGLCEAVCPDELHRSSAAGLRVQPAAVHGADR